MSSEMLDMLKEQAERLLMVLPGHYREAPIEIVRKQIGDMYDFDCRNPDMSARGKAITLRMLSWISSYEWIMASMTPKNLIDPKQFGIFRWHVNAGDTSFAIFCIDEYHYRQFPFTVFFAGKEYTKTDWNRHINRCYYALVNDDFVSCF
jgi:hypothetical protein